MHSSLLVLRPWAPLLFFTSLLNKGMAIKCYTCNSKTDPRCEDPFQPESGLKPVDCIMDQQQGQQTREAIKEVLKLMNKMGQAPVPQSGSAVLPKINESIPLACQKMEFIVMGNVVIGRGCSSNNMDWYHPCETLKLITRDGIELRSCSLCDTDGCNSATIPINAITWVSSILIIFFNILKLTPCI